MSVKLKVIRFSLEKVVRSRYACLSSARVSAFCTPLVLLSPPFCSIFFSDCTPYLLERQGNAVEKMPFAIPQPFFGAKFKAVRLAKGLTLQEVDRRGHIDNGQISKVETGAIKKPTLLTTMKILAGLDMTVQEFFQFCDIPYHSEPSTGVSGQPDTSSVLNQADLLAFASVMRHDLWQARHILIGLLNQSNEARYGIGADSLRFNVDSLDAFFDDSLVESDNVPVYQFTLRYPQAISLEIVLDIDRNNGVLLPEDVAVYIRNAYLQERGREVSDRMVSILKRLDSLVPENIAFQDVVELEALAGYPGHILEMYQRACAFNDILGERGVQRPRWQARERALANLFVLACRWLQFFSPYLDKTWLVDVRDQLYVKAAD